MGKNQFVPEGLVLNKFTVPIPLSRFLANQIMPNIYFRASSVVNLAVKLAQFSPSNECRNPTKPMVSYCFWLLSSKQCS
jgi:hypothetical protein